MKITYSLFIALSVLAIAGCKKEPPLALFSTEKTTYKISETVAFINQSTGGKEFSWDFGDGETSAEENPVHAFESAGTYAVTLTATNGGGTGTFTDSLNIILDISGLWYTTIKYSGGLGGFGNQQAGTMNLAQHENYTLSGSFVFNDGARTAQLLATSILKGNSVAIDFDQPNLKLKGTVNAAVTSMSGTFSGNNGSGTWSATKLD